MSQQYKLMIYFAHSTLVIYSKTIVSNDKMNVAAFRKKNKDVIHRVFEEGLSIMKYELSYEQMNAACLVFLQSKHFPLSVKEKELYTPKKSS